MANKAILETKQEVINEIKEKVSNASSVVFFDYRGLTDAQITNLRRQLKESDSSFKIFKNTLTKRALDELKIDLNEILEGPSAMAISNDEIAPIKILANFGKENEALSIKGGLINGKVTSLDQLKELSTIPSRQGLLTMLAGGLIGVVKDLSICLNMYADEKSE